MPDLSQPGLNKKGINNILIKLFVPKGEVFCQFINCA